MSNTRIWMSGVGLAVVVAVSPSIRAQDTHVKFYGGPAYVAPLSDSDITVGKTIDTVKEQKKVGWNLGVEGRFTKWIGLELDYVHANQDVAFGGSTIGKMTFSPLTATFNIHPVHTKVVDFYLGPSYSYVNWGQIHLNANGGSIAGSSTIGTQSANGWGASVGVDIGLGKHFAICGGLKYLDVDLELANGQNADVKPLVARIDAAFRF